MKLEQIDKLKEGKYYKFKATEYAPNGFDLVENEYTGEYRGFFGDNVLFWIEGESAAREYYYGDVEILR